ncbi:putative ribosome maturation factor RimP, rimP domain superfamily [Helianthus debilis subsp. tardiflorus]
MNSLSLLSYYHQTILLAPPPPPPHHSSNSQSNPQFITFSKPPFCNLTRLITTRVPAKKKNRSPEPLLTPSIVEEVSEVDEFDDEEFDDEGFDDDDDFEDDYLDEDAEPRFGDGGGGGGICLAGTVWDKEVLTIAEEVSLSFDGELGIYAFKTLQNSAIRVRIERLSNKSGSPTMEDIEAFSNAYRERLNQAEAAGSIPVDISLEVSSPGLERVVRVPQDLERFKDRPMYVKYTTREDDVSPSCEHDGVLRLESFDLETKCCTWGIADVKVNREKAGKGRPLNKKQREWRITTPFDSLLLVRIYADF